MRTRTCYLISVHLTLLIPLYVAIPTVPRQNVVINLSTPDENNQTQTVFTTKIDLSNGDVTIDILNANYDNGFFVIQAHSFRYNVSLSTTEDLTSNTYVLGTNIGLVQSPLTTNALYRYYLNHRTTLNIEVLLAVVVYNETDPIPGGCNMVFNTAYAPYQIITYDDNVVKVDAAPAKASSCDVTNLPRLDMYHLYLDEESLDKTSYFNGINNLLTVNHIMKYGTKVSDSVKHLPLRRYYSAYHGTGTAFAIIATYRNSSSAYVPALTYACNINNWDQNCLGPVTLLWKLLCAVILFIGLFMCHFGHRFFKITMFLFGFIFGSFIFYIGINITSMVGMEQSVGYALLFGCAYGICWLILWWVYGIPIMSVSLPVLFIGYITACIIFHTGIADLRIFQNDFNYWGVVFSIMLPITISLLIVTEMGSILACSVVGATAVIIAIDHYVGGSIHYIILNNIRRAIVPNFYLAILDPPFQYKDIILSIAWTGLVVFGIIVQRKQQVGKPPFPPHRTSARTAWERTPLLTGVVDINDEGTANQIRTYR